MVRSTILDTKVSDHDLNELYKKAYKSALKHIHNDLLININRRPIELNIVLCLLKSTGWKPYDLIQMIKNPYYSLEDTIHTLELCPLISIHFIHSYV